MGQKHVNADTQNNTHTDKSNTFFVSLKIYKL